MAPRMSRLFTRRQASTALALPSQQHQRAIRRLNVVSAASNPIDGIVLRRELGLELGGSARLADELTPPCLIPLDPLAVVAVTSGTCNHGWGSTAPSTSCARGGPRRCAPSARVLCWWYSAAAAPQHWRRPLRPSSQCPQSNHTVSSQRISTWACWDRRRPAAAAGPAAAAATAAQVPVRTASAPMPPRAGAAAAATPSIRLGMATSA